jgi:hypothetical protein
VWIIGALTAYWFSLGGEWGILIGSAVFIPIFYQGIKMLSAEPSDEMVAAAVDEINEEYPGWSLEIQMREIELDLEENRVDVGKAFDMIPEHYRTYDAIVTMRQYVIDDRVTTWQDAVNLYENELHQRRMEAKADEAINQARYATQVAEYAKYAAVRAQLQAGRNEWEIQQQQFVNQTLRQRDSNRFFS